MSQNLHSSTTDVSCRMSRKRSQDVPDATTAQRPNTSDETTRKTRDVIDYESSRMRSQQLASTTRRQQNISRQRKRRPAQPAHVYDGGLSRTSLQLASPKRRQQKARHRRITEPLGSPKLSAAEHTASSQLAD